MTREEAISVLENPDVSLGITVRVGQDDDYWKKLRPALKMAISALRAQQETEKNEPLLPDELREMDGDKIYIQFIGACKGFYDDEYAPYYGKQELYIQEYNGMLRACDLPLKYYAESWLAYRRKPEEGTK